MSDFESYSDDVNRLIVLEAMRECAPDASDLDVATKVVEVRRRLRRYESPKNVVARTLGAIVIRGILEDARFEESSQRYVVTFRPIKEGAEIETIRTDRRDANPDVDRMITSLTLGEQMVVYKTTEPMGDGSGRKVRIAPLLIPLPAKR